VQAKNDSQANITYTDIATLVQRGNVSLAREKAEKLVMDEAYGDLLEELELQIGVVQEHFHELERRYASLFSTNRPANSKFILQYPSKSHNARSHFFNNLRCSLYPYQRYETCSIQ
jgi:hypothetical protein